MRVSLNCCRILRMDGLDDRVQSAHARLVRICHIQAEIIDHPPVEEGRLAVGRQPPDMARNHVHELRKLPLPVAQRRLGPLLILNVYCRAVPLGNAPLAVA